MSRSTILTRISALVTSAIIIHAAAAEQSESQVGTKASEGARDDSTGYVRGKVTSVIDGGILGQVSFREDGKFPKSTEAVAIFGSFPPAIEGTEWEGAVYPTGNYTVVKASGDHEIRRGFATTPLEASTRSQSDKSKIEETKIAPPFGIRWGVKAEEIERRLAGAKATITARERKGQNERWTVNGLTQDGQRNTVFEFTEEKLSGVALSYSKSDWSEDAYKKYFDQVRARIASKYGEPMAESDPDRSGGSKADGSRKKLREVAWKRSETSIHLDYWDAAGPGLPPLLTVRYGG